MKINKNSWHYKFSDKMHYEVKQDLCGYFRELVLSLVMMAVLGVVYLFSMFSMVYFVVSFIIALPQGENLFFIVGTVAWTVTVVTGVFFLVMYIKNSLPAKSKKSKYCPLLEFTDD